MAPNVPLAFVGNAGIDASLAIVGPGVLASLSLAIPSRVRSVGFSIGALFVLPGFLVLPVVGALGDAVGFRYGLLILVPIFVIGGLIVASAGSLIGRDVQDVWTSMRTRTQMLVDRQAGRLPLLAVRELSVGYDGVVVLADVAIEIGEGEIVALVGTNGAGKSTLLRAIGGVVEADHGAIVFDGRDITHLPPDEIARLGVAQVPGGEGIFPNLRVEDNLRVAAWQGRRRGEHDADMIDEALAAFPLLASRREERAANLSGGQQQMLALAMATITRPKLFLIDELSLGLSPIRGRAAARRDRVDAPGRHRHPPGRAVDERRGGGGRPRLRHGDRRRALLRDGRRAGRPPRAPVVRLPPEGLRGARVAGARPRDAERRSGRAEIEVRGLSLSFGGNNALYDVSLHADHGEIVGIIGPNGAGKTTLFDVVSGFLRPDAGRVELAGVDVTDRTASARARLGLGRSFQDSRLFSGLTVRDAVAVSLERFTDVSDPFNAMLRLPLQVRTEAAVMQRVDELLDLFGLDRYADNLVSELSTGSRRLVDLAAVVAHQPSVVLLDEPSSGVAQREVEAMVGLLRNVRDRLDATMLVVEHDIAFIAELADRLVAMDRGAVLTSGPPRDVLESPVVVRGLPRLRPARPLALGRRRHTDAHDHGGGPAMSDSEPDPGTAPARAERPWPAVSLLRRAGPVVLIVAALIAAGVSATTHENKGTTSATPAEHRERPADRALDGAAHLRRGGQGGQDVRLRLGLRVRPRDGPPEDADRLRPALRARLHGGQRRRHLERRVGQFHQRRLLPGSAGRPGGDGLERGRHQRPGARHRPGLRGHVQPGLRAVRTAREPDPLHRLREPTTTRWPPTPTPSPSPNNSTPSPPSTGRVRPPPTRTSWPACTCCAWCAATRPPTARSRRTRPSSGPTCPRPTPRSTRRSTTSSPS